MTEQGSPTESSGPCQNELWDGLAVAAVAAFVVLAGLVGRLLQIRESPIFAGFPPIQGVWHFQVSWLSLPSVGLAAAVISYGRCFSFRARWSVLLAAAFVVAVGWIFGLTLVDGVDVGFTERLTSHFDYLAALPQVASWSALFRDFTGSIPIDSVQSWPTHVAGHPPGVLVPFELLDRLGLGGGAWAALLCLLVGSSSAVALLVAARRLVDETAARSLAPFAALTPGAVWIGVSGDALFLGAATWGIASLSVACTTTSYRRVTSALLSGVLLGMCIYLSYGLVLILPIAAVLVAARGRPATGAWVGLGFLLVVALVTSLGFNWWSGYQLVTERYSAGLGGVRNYGYWAWANLAAFALACGPAVVVGVRRLLAGARWAGTWSVIRDPRNTMSVIVGTTLVMVAVATLGGLSKGEVERIWLPFGGVLLLACVAIPASRARLWLIAQVVLVLCIQNLVMTPW